MAPCVGSRGRSGKEATACRPLRAGQVEFPAGSVCDQTAISLDLMPTMLELAGADVPSSHHLDGMSLAPVLLNQKSLGPRKLYWDYNGRRAMRDGPWKLVVGEKGAKNAALFHLGNDLGEKNDLATAQSQRVDSMLADLETWYAGRPGWSHTAAESSSRGVIRVRTDQRHWPETQGRLGVVAFSPGPQVADGGDSIVPTP